MNMKDMLNRKKAELLAAHEINKNTKTIIKLCGDSMKVKVCVDTDGARTYVVTIRKLEFIAPKIYKKTMRTYEIPCRLVEDKGLTMDDIIEFFDCYMTSYEESYVDNKNKPVDAEVVRHIWATSESTGGKTNKKA